MPTPENLTLPERQRDDESSCSSDGSWDVLWGRTKQPTPSKCTMSKDPACAYRGFSTSLSHSFVNLREEPGDACALVCCGLLQQDRNRFLVMGKKPPSCAERIIALVFVPSCILAISIYLLLFVSDYDYDYVDFTSVAFLCLLVVYIGFLLWEASSRRAEFRRDVLWHKYGQTGAVLLPPEDLEELPPELREDYMMGQTARDSFRAHALIGCYDNDIVYKDMDAPPPQHILACLWRLYMASCCGTQGFYIQCCGVCGVAQETRDIDKIVPPHRRAVDYLTMQPVLEYYSEMMVHRKKCCTVVLSKLSWKILIAFVLSTVLTIGACLLLSPSHLQLMVSLPAVASIILGSVVCCSGLSTDAVIKFLACGFCIAGSMTFFAQGIVAVIVQGAIYIAMTLADGRDYYVGTYADDEYKTAFFIPLKMGFVAEFRKEYPISYLCCFFFYCFFVAAFIEEPIKYLAYRMLSDHPDFWSKRRLEIVIAGTRLDRRSTVDPDVLPNSQAQERTLRSRSAIFLVAMVAVSLGFACCENLLFALMCYNQDIEWRATLIRVLLLPIHPVCAAWQSIGVSQRDLEHNRNYQLGWILLPAVFWHGLFDFALLLGPVLVENEWVDVDEWLLPSVVLAIALLLLILNIIAQQVRLQGESEEGMDIWATLSCQFAPKNKFFKAKERAVAADSESGESYATATGVELISEAMDGIRFDLPEKKRKSWFAADAISHSVSSPEIPHCYSPPDIREIRTAPTDLRGSASDVSDVSSVGESEASGKIDRWPSLERKENGSLVVSTIAPVQGLEMTLLAMASEETAEMDEIRLHLPEKKIKSWFAADAISHAVSSPEIPHCYSPPDIRGFRTAPTDLRGSASDVSGVSSASESEASGKIDRWPSLELKENGSLVVPTIAPVHGLETALLVLSEETADENEICLDLPEKKGKSWFTADAISHAVSSPEIPHCYSPPDIRGFRTAPTDLRGSASNVSGVSSNVSGVSSASESEVGISPASEGEASGKMFLWPSLERRENGSLVVPTIAPVQGLETALLVLSEETADINEIRLKLPEKKRKNWFAADAISHAVSSPEIPHCYPPPDIREIRLTPEELTAPTDLRGSASNVSGVSSASESEASGKIVRWPSLERKESGSLVVSSIAPVQGLETTVLVHSEETEETAEDATALEESRYAKSEHDASDDNRSSSSPPTSAYSVNEPQTPQNLDKGKGAKRVCEVEIVPSRQQCHITTSPFQECVGEDESILQAPSGGTGVNYTAHMNNVANRLAAVQQFIAETNANLVPIGKSESVVVSASDRLAALQQILAETHANLPAVESSTSFDALSTPAVRQLGSRGIDVLSTSAARQLGLRANLSAIKANLPVADRSGTSVGAEATTQSQLYIGSRANLSTTQANPASDDHGDSIALDKASTQSQVTVNLSATQSNLPAADNDDDSIASDEATTQSQVTVNLPAAANNGDFTATVKAATQSQLVSYVNFPAADNDGNSIASDEATTRSQVTVVRTRL